jgi:cell division topological specificity factor
MNLFRSFQLAASAPVARERLQILLEYERKLGSQIDLFTVLREEILAVVTRHVADPEKVQVTVDRGAKFSTLGVNIEIPNTGGKARTLPTDFPVLHRDKAVRMLGARVNKGQMRRGVDAAAGTLAVPIWLAGATVGAILLAAKRAGGIALITSLFRVGLIAVVALGAWLYVQQRDVSERRTLDDRNTALMPGFETAISNAPHPAEGVVAAARPSVILQGMSAPGTVASLPRDPGAAEPVLPKRYVGRPGWFP